jgi:hypothetical protein
MSSSMLYSLLGWSRRSSEYAAGRVSRCAGAGAIDLHDGGHNMSDATAKTRGINHLGLSVLDIDSTSRFFVQLLGWVESGRDESYPRTAVSDGHTRLTLWQVDRSLDVQPFNRRRNVGCRRALRGLGPVRGRGCRYTLAISCLDDRRW